MHKNVIDVAEYQSEVNVSGNNYDNSSNQHVQCEVQKSDSLLILTVELSFFFKEEINLPVLLLTGLKSSLLSKINR